MTAAYQKLCPRQNPELLSFVIPLFNEETVVPLLKNELCLFLAKLSIKTEVILVDDGSSDATYPQLLRWAQEDARIKIIAFSRNFGHQAAVSAGLSFAKGDATVIMDADLQDPPEVVLQMLEKYRDGYDVVYGVRKERLGETPFKKFSAWCFYRVMKNFIHKDLPEDTGDFRLISRRCLDTLLKFKERHRFLRGLFAWIGYEQIGIYYKRQPRIAGETKYPLIKMMKFAWTAAVSFSPLPLQIISGLGLGVACFGFAIGLYALSRYFLYLNGLVEIYNPGWATIVTLICLIGGCILISIGIVGEYVGRIFEESKSRPYYIISHSFHKETDDLLSHSS